jgi:hypothetical protein
MTPTSLRIIAAGALVVTAAVSAALVAPLTGAGSAVGPRAMPADTGIVTLRIPADADATVDSSRPDTPLGATGALTIGYAVGPDRATTQALLHFPLPELPSGATIVSATLLLDTIAVRGRAEVRVLWGAVDRSWRESDVTWSTRPAVPDPYRIGLVGGDLAPLLVDMTNYVESVRGGGLPDHGLALWVEGGASDAGRSRTFASREALADVGAAPTLVIAYVGPGTPHPYPSATPTVTPTPSPSPTGTLPPTPSPTTTSTFGLWQGQAALDRPSDGAQLSQPVGDDAWVFEWWQPSRGPCMYSGALLTLIDPGGASTQQDVPGTSYRFEDSRPVRSGRWAWNVYARCAHGPTTVSETRVFYVDAPPSSPTPSTGSTAVVTASPSPTATDTPAPPARVFLPIMRKTAPGGG